MKTKKTSFALWCTLFLALIVILIVIGRFCGIPFWQTKHSESSDAQQTMQQTTLDAKNNQTDADKQELIAVCPDLSAWNMVLVNDENPVPDDYQFELSTVDGNSTESYEFDSRAADALTEMLDAGCEEGLELYIVSTYRTPEHQEELFNQKISEYEAQGKTEEEAIAAAAEIVTPSKCSEHNIGLAADILGSGYSILDSGFADTDAGKWLAEHCTEYGFILRYPENKTEQTGITFEPWHFRYVGKEAAQYITKNDLCLEEFIQLRKAAE
ncbi:MAG: M15 family metallopeptidase [Butyricicoccaceae bacterium]